MHCAFFIQSVACKVYLLYIRERKTLGEGRCIGIAHFIVLEIDFILQAFVGHKAIRDGRQLCFLALFQESCLGLHFVFLSLNTFIYVLIILKELRDGLLTYALVIVKSLYRSLEFLSPPMNKLTRFIINVFL